MGHRPHNLCRDKNNKHLLATGGETWLFWTNGMLWVLV
jgi:hypothetical protein